MTKKELLARCSTILNETKSGSVITDSDKDFLIDIFQYHKNWDKIKGVGINYITTSMTVFNGKIFMIVRVDGSRVTISYVECVNNIKKINDKKAN